MSVASEYAFNGPERVEAILPDTKRHLMVVDDDPLFRESIAQNLADSGYSVETFADGLTFLSRLAEGPEVDLLLLDWKMPRMDGMEILSRTRRSAPDLPVIFLTVLNDQLYEEAALLAGAVDFIEKSRSFSIVLRRIQLIPGNRRRNPEPGAQDMQKVVKCGPLRLDLEAHRAYWKSLQVDLTLSEFGLVRTLAEQPGMDMPYREIYDIVRSRGFPVDGSGRDHRANVRSSIKRIRQKFRSIDPDFTGIENYPGFGYRWRAPN